MAQHMDISIKWGFAASFLLKKIKKILKKSLIFLKKFPILKTSGDSVETE